MASGGYRNGGYHQYYYYVPVYWSDSSSSDEEEAELPKSEGLPEEEAELPKSPWLGLYHGHVIARMISHTLGSWCRHWARPKIYVVTPFIDKEGLQMIRDAIGQWGKIEALYTRDKDDDPLGSKMKGILAEENFVKLRVGPREIGDQKHYYHCKFVAAEFAGRVEILMTSANLTADHFMREQIDSVHKYEVTPWAFRNEYLKKLDEHSEDYNWPRAACCGYKPEQQNVRAPYAPTRQVVCYNCDKEGHYSYECHDFHRRQQQTKRAFYAPTRHGKCYTCGEYGHYARECPDNSHPGYY